MSDQEFERYLKVLGDLLKITRPQRDAIAAELRDHFDARLDEMMAAGVSREVAIRQTLEEFGDVAGLAHQFVDLAQGRQRKRIIRATTFSMGGMAVAVLLLFAMWPENARVQMTSTTVAQAEVAKPSATSAEVVDDEESAADRALSKVLKETTDVEFVDVPLKEAFVDFLATKHNIEIVLDKASLNTAGVDETTAVTITFKGGQLQSAINLILKRFDLDWYIDDGALVIASASDVQNTLRTRVYNVSDLLRMGGERTSTEWHPLLLLLQRHTGGRLAGWSDAGGAGNVLSSVDGVMVVSQTPKAHDEIQGFLSALRESRDWLVKGGKGTTRSIRAQHESDAETAIVKKLEGKCKPMEFVGTPLQEVMAFLAEREGIAIQLDNRALESAGVAADTAIDFKLRNATTLRTAVGRMLRQHSLTAIVQNDVLLVTTLETADNAVATRIYPLSDLLSADPDQAQDELANFVRVITTTTGNPRVSWMDLGGTGIIDEAAGLRALAVTTTQETHEQIDKLLESIRRSRRNLPKGQMPKVGTDTATNGLTVKVWFVNSTKGGDGAPILADQLKATILELLDIDGESPTLKFMTSLSDRLVVRATPALHRRIEKLATKELSGLLSLRMPSELDMSAKATNGENLIGGASAGNSNNPPVLPPASNE